MSVFRSSGLRTAQCTPYVVKRLTTQFLLFVRFLNSQEPQTSVPVGHWRDSLWDIFKHGYCHCSALNSCCCVPVAAGQVITRAQLTWLGKPPDITTTAVGAFRTLLCLVFSFWVTRVLLLIVIAILDPNTDSPVWIDPPTSYYVVCAIDDLLAVAYFGFTIVVLRNLRSHVRSKYAIPEANQCPAGFEDTCCSIFCSCCVAAQMMRHTANYEVTPGRCCTDTGTPKNAPSIV